MTTDCSHPTPSLKTLSQVDGKPVQRLICDDCKQSWWRHGGTPIEREDALELLATQRLDVVRTDSLLGTGAVAKIFSTSPRTVSNWAQSGKLRGIRTCGGHWRFRLDDVENLLNDQGGIK